MTQTYGPRGVKCELGRHLLKEDSVFVTNPKYIAFIRKRKKSFRPNHAVCNECFLAMEKIYKIKYKRFVELTKNSSLTVSSTTAELSDDSIDRLVNRSSSYIFSRDREQNNNISNSSESSSVMTVRQNVINAVKAGRVTVRRKTFPISNTESSIDSDRPTTSAAAAAKRLRTRSPRQATGAMAFVHRVVDDDDEYVPSPNALNNTRLPHIQPIIKRRKVVQFNQSVMDRYIRTGLIGG